MDSESLLYMDHRLVIPKGMRENMLRVIHFGHARRDSMLIIHREIIDKARNCSECQVGAKNFECLKSQ